MDAGRRGGFNSVFNVCRATAPQPPSLLVQLFCNSLYRRLTSRRSIISGSQSLPCTGEKAARLRRRDQKSHLTPHTSHLTPTPHTSHLTPHTSHLTPHTSHLTPHTSHLTPHTSHLTPHTSHLTPHTSHLTPHTSHHHTSRAKSPE